MPKKGKFMHEFVCPHEGCENPDHAIQIGKGMATPLSGFIAGVIVTSIVLLPVLYWLGQLYPIGILSAAGR